MRYHKMIFMFFIAVLSLSMTQDVFASDEEISGGYIIVFVQNDSISIFEGEDRINVVTLMLDMQKSYLERKYGLEVQKNISTIRSYILSPLFGKKNKRRSLRQKISQIS